MTRIFVCLALMQVRDRVSCISASPTVTPDSNTGSNCHPTDLDFDLTVRIDWVTAVFPISDRENVLELIQIISKEFHDDVELAEGQGRRIGKQYAHSARGSRGALFTWNLLEDCHGSSGSLRVALNAQTLQHCRQDDLWLFLGHLQNSYQAKCTRIDVAIDDYSKSLDPQLMLDAYRAGDCGIIRKMSHVMNYRSGEPYGWTLNFGSRESESFVRYYDKDAESNGAVPTWRLEAEFKGDKAQKVLGDIATLPLSELHELAPKYLGVIVLGCLAFVDRDGKQRRLKRCPNLPWWQDFIDRVGGSLRVVCPRPRPTLHRKVRWLRDQVIPSIATIELYHELESMAHNFEQHFRSWVDASKARLSKANESLVKAARMEPFLDMRDIDYFLGKYEVIT